MIGSEARMTPERWRQIEEIFHAAQACDAGVRGAYLAQACGADDELRKEIEQLLAPPASGFILDSSNWDATKTVLPGIGTFGAYRILSELGKGGMGAVYLAEDKRLGRKVAIKVTHSRYSERFEREARAIAALNHTNVCTLYDIGPNYFVMEFCEGETLASRLKRGKLTAEETARIGAAVAAALAAAHLKGIIHRDLKPANIILSKSGPKVLDFGLAKSNDDPTLTAADIVVGTPAYMAPEQRNALPTDHRTDIYALGLVLREMAAGKREAGEDSTIPGSPQLAALIDRCTRVDPDERWQSAADISHQLAWIAGAAGKPSAVIESAGSAMRRTLLLVALIAGAIASGFGIARLSSFAPKTSPERTTLQVPIILTPFTEEGFDKMPTVSPDGRYIAYLGKQGTNPSKLWVRALAEPDARPIAGTDGAQSPFWSPDSHWIGYLSMSEGKVKKVAPSEGPPQTMFSISGEFQEPVWGSHGDILYHPLNRMPLFRLPESGGVPRQITRFDAARTENSHRGQQFLPDGRRFLFVARCGDRTYNALYIASLDGGEMHRLMSVDSYVRLIVPYRSDRGRLFYYRDGALVWRTFNLRTEQIEGEAHVALQNISYNPTGLEVGFQSSADGLVSLWRDNIGSLPTLTWFSRSGEKLAEVGEPAERIQIRVSPVGEQVVYAGVDPQTGNRDIFVLDAARGVTTRLTDNVANDWFPVWNPDGKTVAFVSDRPNGGVFLRGISRADDGDTMFFPHGKQPEDWTRDGRWIGGIDGLGHLWTAPAVPNAKQTVFPSPSRIRPDGLRFSPDSKWVAYVTADSGDYGVEVRPFRDGAITGDPIRLTTKGADYPVWNPKGGELFYLTSDLNLWSLDTRRLGAGPLPAPVRLFELCGTGVLSTPPLTGASYMGAYDTPDGKRFLANCTTQPLTRFQLLVNPTFAR